jgi:hypothetical protein
VDNGQCESFSPPVLASYLVDYNGNLYYDVRHNVLKPAVNPESMTINPPVNLLAVQSQRVLGPTSDAFVDPDARVRHSSR